MAENKSTGFITAASNAERTIVTSIINQLENRNIYLDEYSKECAINAVSAINNMLYTAGLNWNSPNLDPSNYQDVIKKVAVQKLNAAASNREVYFQFRNTKIGDAWKKIIEVGIEGDGNDAILRNFGVDVEKVYPYWAVREGDVFEYPTFSGIDVTPPKWTPKGDGKVVRVVYPIKLKSGVIDYRIAERADVVRNLHAHIMNNMMNETFGICADRYKATAEQKAQIEAKKSELKAKIKDMSLDELLDFPDIQPWISPSWSEPHSREAMILRKMRNNAIKKFPKDFGSAYALDAYNQLTDESVSSVSEEIRLKANTGDFIDAEFEDTKPAEKGDENADKNTGDGL
ncbi:MAG: hypothetical protein K2J11_00145 [Oscillospiraceae bacterium]|nr:hypothetical protein [Oscillospiraceae bacterium]